MRKKFESTHARPPSDGGEAFLSDMRDGPVRTSVELAQHLAEEFVASATSAEDAMEDDRNRAETEEIGGPFLEVSPTREFGLNDEEGTEEPFPTAMRSVRS